MTESTWKAMFGRTPILCPLLSALLLQCAQVKAQQDPLFTTYMWNMMTVNPGYAGSADVMNATLTCRKQWVGYEGAPSTNSLIVHSPLRNRKLGLGVAIIDDRIGPSRTSGFYGDFAYRVRLNKTSRLAFGLKAGFTSMRMNMTSVSGTNAADPVFQSNISGGLHPNFGFGMYYWNKMSYLGISVPKLLDDQLLSGNENGSVTLYSQRRHYFLVGGYVWSIARSLKFRPSFLVRAVEGAPLSADVSANFLIMEKLWTGAAYRSSKEVSAILSYQLNDQLRAGYAYDMTLSELKGQQGGSHEVMLSYDLSFTKRLLRSPRYF